MTRRSGIGAYRTPLTVALALVVSALGVTAFAQAGDDELDIPESIRAKMAAAQGEGGKEDKKEFPPHDEVLKDCVQINSTVEKGPTLFNVFHRTKDDQVYAELPGNFANQRYFIAMTVAGGELYAGLQAGDKYVYWKRYEKTLALIEPNVEIRSTGEQESKDSVKRLFTDRVLLSVPIVTMGPSGGPVIDLNNLLVGNATTFFGGSAAGANSKLVSVETIKAFPENIEIAYEVPVRGGQFETFHYSISSIPGKTGYQPRAADERVGYFTTSYSDLGKYTDDETRVRYINRWNLEKRDPSLELSPPKEPIIFYIEHTTPVRYRRWVREGVLYWNQAFEKIGIKDAIEVYYQDKESGAHMEKDPEDVRYNFIRWLNNNIGTAIGPSRVNPLTGQILDADIVLTDGWIRHYWNQYHKVMPQIAMEGFSPETWAWLATRPNWDPRVRLAPPELRDQVVAELSRNAGKALGGHPMGQIDATLIGDDEFDGLYGRTSQLNGMCNAAGGMAFDLAMMRMLLLAEASSTDEGKDEKKEGEKKEKRNLLDGIPEEFIGPLVAELVAHECGHTLGLRHNFKASSIYTLGEINSDAVKGKEQLSASVMDYLPVNFRMESGAVQGDYTMSGIGPYDLWAIEYGYTLSKDLKPILARAAEGNLPYGTDEDTMGPDPLAKRYDFSKEPLDYANEQIKLANFHRERLLEKYVKEGQSWSKAREGYELTLGFQLRSVSMMADWVGGSFVNRDKKGDPNGRTPITAVPAAQQRAALKFVIDNAFRDEAFGLNPKLLNHLSTDLWYDAASRDMDPTWPVHDRIMGIQASALTMVMNPTTLKNVYDNELRTSADEDMLTLPELLDTIGGAIWTELDSKPNGKFTARKPMISSLRRNLQSEHLERLIDLSLPGAGSSAAFKPIATLSTMQLRTLKGKIDKVLTGGADPYTEAHLADASKRIERALESQMIYNANALGGGFPAFPFFQTEGATSDK